MKTTTRVLIAVLLCGSIASAATHDEPTSRSDIVSLREYVDIRFDAQEKATTAALASAERAVAKAEAASDKRFDSVNEFRAALNDSARTQMPRSEAEQAIKGMSEKIDDLAKRVSANEERGRGLNQGWVLMVGIVGVVSSIVTIGFALYKKPRV